MNEESRIQMSLWLTHLIMVERVAQEDRRQQETEVKRIIQADFNL